MRRCGSLQVSWRSLHGELPSQRDIRSLWTFCGDAEYPDRIINIVFPTFSCGSATERRASPTRQGGRTEMHRVPLVLGLITSAAGIVMVGFAIPINQFGLGNTLIDAGTTAIVGG